MIKKIYIRKIILTCFISVTLISIGAAISAETALRKYSELKNTLHPFNITQASKDEASYYIKEYGEIIGVFGNNGELLYTVDIYIKTLPASDRSLLRDGIVAHNCEELYEILGDYDS